MIGPIDFLLGNNWSTIGLPQSHYGQQCLVDVRGTVWQGYWFRPGLVVSAQPSTGSQLLPPHYIFCSTRKQITIGY